MHDAVAEPTSAAWLSEYRRERLARLERENAMLRRQRDQAYRLLGLAVRLACPGGYLPLLAALEHADDVGQQIERTVRVLQETAP